jgi:hypothetical protein
VGTLPPQRPHLAGPQELRRRGSTQKGTATHLNGNKEAARVTREQVDLKLPKS